jgi:hypothetical protein
MTLPLGPLVCAVQTNCHIADALHATDLSLCTFLLQMREFYRWEMGLPFGAALARDAVGAWLAERESHWSELEGQDFVSLPTGEGGQFDAFNVAGLNERLLPHGLIYGAGLAGPHRPGFFLAQLDALRQRDDGLTVQVCGRELARGLFAPPAALQGDTIVLRRESLARWLWEKFEVFDLKRADGPFKAVSDAYGLAHDFHAGLPRMLEEQGETLILHEVGEHRAGRWLEPGWEALRLTLHDRRTDLHVRAVRDLLADLVVTLPTLLQRDAATAVHFWFAGFDGVRRLLYPSLMNAYQAWCRGDGGTALQHAAQRGALHFAALAQQVLATHAQFAQSAGPRIEALLTAESAICAE